MTDDWPFADSKNVAAISSRRIFAGGVPILLVSRDADDGTWQFLTGERFSMDEAIIVALHTVVALDPSVKELAELPSGWKAWRASRDASWQIARDSPGPETITT